MGACARKKKATGTWPACLEWYTRVDGVVTIKDAGTYGDLPDAAVVKRLVRELHRAPVTFGSSRQDERRAEGVDAHFC